MHVKEITRAEAKALVSSYHYLGNKPFRCSAAFGLVDDSGELVGAAVFHSPSAPETMVGAFGLPRNQQQGFFELGRFVLKPDLNGGNWGSFLLGRSIRLLRKTRECRAIITYADSSLHVGALYQATNFTYCGLSAPKKDFYVNGKIQERGKTKGVEGEWRPRPRKHRYILVFDKSLELKWKKEPYVKRN